MTDTTKTKRPFWRKRRFYGSLLGIVSAGFVTIPGAPVLVTIGAVAITTQTVSVVAGLAATGWFGYGQGRKVEREGE